MLQSSVCGLVSDICSFPSWPPLRRSATVSPLAIAHPPQTASPDHWLETVIRRKAVMERLQVPQERDQAMLAVTMLWIESMHKVRPARTTQRSHSSRTAGRQQICTRIASCYGPMRHEVQLAAVMRLVLALAPGMLGLRACAPRVQNIFP